MTFKSVHSSMHSLSFFSKKILYYVVGGVFIIKGAKAIVEYNEKLYLHYFEKSPLIGFNELFNHPLELCWSIYEVELQSIWRHFIVLEESF